MSAALQRLNDGLAHQRAGRLREAEAAYREVLEAEPGQPDALHLLGVLARRAGDPARAADLIGRAIEADGDRPEYHANLGNALRDLGRGDEAVTAYRRALALSPDMASAHSNLSLALAAAGDAEAAVEHAERAAELAPEAAEVHYNRGNALRAAGRLDEAAAAYVDALQLAPDLVDALHDLSAVLRNRGRLEEAVSTARRGLEVAPDDAGLHNALGLALLDQGDVVEAEAALAEAVRLDDGFALAHNNLGLALQALGRLDAAAAAFERAIELAPERGEPWRHLGLLGASVAGDGRAEALEARLAGTEPGSRDELHLRFALGKALADRGEHARAFESYRRGNALQRATLDYDPAWTTELVTRLIDTFDAERVPGGAPYADHSELPVLIVGMPRSGTTLVEQMLAAHPGVYAGGELDFFARTEHRLAQTLGADETWPECVVHLDEDTARDIAQTYLTAMLEAVDNALRITDKMPRNFFSVGLFAMLFPRGRVVSCRRDPRDACLSIYFQLLGSGHPYACDLAELGAFYRDYERLMEHWRGILPDRVFDVDYEELVADPESAGRRLTDFLGIPWDERCLAFHQSDRAVLTASNVQVREPVHTRSVGRWRAYERELAPLLEALGIGGSTTDEHR